MAPAKLDTAMAGYATVMSVRSNIKPNINGPTEFPRAEPVKVKANNIPEKSLFAYVDVNAFIIGTVVHIMAPIRKNNPKRSTLFGGTTHVKRSKNPVIKKVKAPRFLLSNISAKGPIPIVATPAPTSMTKNTVFAKLTISELLKNT